MIWKCVTLASVCAVVLCALSCGHEQQLVSIQIQPSVETFGAANIPVSADRGLSVQLLAQGTYIHPPVTKDITDKVTWFSDTPDLVTVTPTGLLTATGDGCGNGIVTATIVTNRSTGGLSSSGAEVAGSMTATVVCFTGP
ncbi:MAG: hypothetical protein ACRD2U_15785 [Terriglobales bacterium]